MIEKVLAQKKSLMYSLFLFLQIWVLITTLALVSVGTWGTLLIRQHFDPVLLLPANTYLRSYLAVHRNHFPQVGLTENKPLVIPRRPFFQ